ncbi:hypothetical protein M2158_003146 [Streptomyces sp. SAI-144]|uniref:DUF397 domain-containing protein n=1 Tax=Streptomyces sp. SAI-144 TaxID=2940544 RepID=UPI0024743E14|nr:DUF397 domain-containing protein [Streptomyces sp. SAI-144]MDH6434669.1 hypothetical protein [Streptomyces sp. SAI-144]
MTKAPTHEWFKSSYSGGSGTECVEAAFVQPGILVRDSKAPERPYLVMSAGAWESFLSGVRLPEDF